MELYWSQFILLAAAHLAAVVSPGPDFLITLKQSLHRGLKPALWTAVGIGCGILVHVSYVVFGVAVLLRNYPIVFTVVQCAGAAYLIWLAWQCLRSSGLMTVDLSRQNMPAQSTASAFLLGFWTNVLNPKATLFFLSLYTAVVSLTTPVSVQIFYGVWMALVTAGWFCFMSWVMVKPPIRERFLRAGAWVDRLLGVLLLLIAARLLISVFMLF